MLGGKSGRAQKRTGEATPTGLMRPRALSRGAGGAPRSRNCFGPSAPCSRAKKKFKVEEVADSHALQVPGGPAANA